MGLIQRFGKPVKELALIELEVKDLQVKDFDAFDCFLQKQKGIIHAGCTPSKEKRSMVKRSDVLDRWRVEFNPQLVSVEQIHSYFKKKGFHARQKGNVHYAKRLFGFYSLQ